MKTAHYIRHKDIDKSAWNRCIRLAVNGDIYGFSWFLDWACDDWDAIISLDYTIVMPLPFKTNSRMAIEIPEAIPSLGIYFASYPKKETITHFIHAIPDGFEYVKLIFNKYIEHPDLSLISEHKSWELDLINPYHRYIENYSIPHKEVLHKTHINKISVLHGLRPVDFMEVYTDHLIRKKVPFHKYHLDTVRRIITRLIQRRIGEIHGAYSGTNNLSAVAFFTWSHHKATLLYCAFNSEGAQNNALHAIIDSFIQYHCEKNITLKAENNLLPSDDFWEGFGAIAAHNSLLKIDRRAWYKKIFST